MDRLPPTITDADLLALLGSVLALAPAPQATAALRLRSFQPGFSWQALVDLALAHEVLPPLIFALQTRSLLPPLPASLCEAARSSHVTSRLDAAYAEHLDRQTDLRQQLVAALAALNANGIVPVLLKGAVHLTLPQSGWHGARAMRDLDILVRGGEAQRANTILSKLGYRADPNPPPHDRHLPELHLPGRAGAVEIHTEALSFPARFALTTEEVFARAERWSFAGANFQVLPPQWHALHGLLHHQLCRSRPCQAHAGDQRLVGVRQCRRRDAAPGMGRHHRPCQATQHPRHAVELVGANEPPVRARSSRSIVTPRRRA